MGRRRRPAGSQDEQISTPDGRFRSCGWCVSLRTDAVAIRSEIAPLLNNEAAHRGDIAPTKFSMIPISIGHNTGTDTPNRN